MEGRRMTAVCVRPQCDRPTDGIAYACQGCAEKAREQLEEIGELLPAALDVAYGQTSHASGGSGTYGPREELRLAAKDRLDKSRGLLGTWVRHIAPQREGHLPHDTLDAIAEWLIPHLEWARGKRWAEEFLADIEACAGVIRGVAEPGGLQRVIVGLCDCGKTLYAIAGRHTATCKNCNERWAVDESREALRGHLDERLVTAAEAAHLGAYLDTDRTSGQVRKLINKWASRGRIEERGLNGGWPTYRFGDIAQMIAESPRRVAETTTA